MIHVLSYLVYEKESRVSTLTIAQAGDYWSDIEYEGFYCWYCVVRHEMEARYADM